MDSDNLRTSPSLLDGLLANEDKYWQRMVTIYGPLVERWIRKSRLQATSVDDVKQDVFIAVSQNLSRYKQSPDVNGSFRRWLWGVTRNKLVDLQRAQIKNEQARGGTDANLQIHDLPSQPFEDANASELEEVRKDVAARAMQLLKSDFEESTWTAFWLTAVEGLETKFAAEKLGLTTKAVRQARYRVLKRLRDELGNDLPGDELDE